MVHIHMAVHMAVMEVMGVLMGRGDRFQWNCSGCFSTWFGKMAFAGVRQLLGSHTSVPVYSQSIESFATAILKSIEEKTLRCMQPVLSQFPKRHVFLFFEVSEK